MMPAHLGARLPKFIKNRQLIHRMKNTLRAKDPHCEELPHLQLPLLPLQQRSLPMPQLALLQQLPLQPLLQQLSHQALSSKVAQKRYAEAMSLVYWRISVTPRF
jgi:hypothetical protein